MTRNTYSRGQILNMLTRFIEENDVHTRTNFDQMNGTCSSATVVERFDGWHDALEEAAPDDVEVNSGKSTMYSDEELIDMLQRTKESKGVCSPRAFNDMDDTCSASAVMKRFGTWSDAKEAAGINEDLSSTTGAKREYEDEDVLSDIRECARRNCECDNADEECDCEPEDGRVTVRLLQAEGDLVSPSVAVERFGSWSEAKKKAGLDDGRLHNSRPRTYSDEDYIRMLKACAHMHGEVTQRTFNDKKHFPTSGAVRKRFADENGNNGWSRAKKEAGVATDNKRWTNEELLEQLRECKRQKGSCSAAKFASIKGFASPETVQRRFGGWNDAKEEAGIKSA